MGAAGHGQAAGAQVAEVAVIAHGFVVDGGGPALAQLAGMLHAHEPAVFAGRGVRTWHAGGGSIEALVARQQRGAHGVHGPVRQIAELATGHRTTVPDKARCERGIVVGRQVQVVGHRDIQTAITGRPDAGCQEAGDTLIAEREGHRERVVEHRHILDAQGHAFRRADACRRVQAHAARLQCPELVARFAAAEFTVLDGQHFAFAVIDNHAGRAMHAVLVQHVGRIVDAVLAVGLIDEGATAGQQHARLAEFHIARQGDGVSLLINLRGDGVADGAVALLDADGTGDVDALVGVLLDGARGREEGGGTGRVSRRVEHLSVQPCANRFDEGATAIGWQRGPLCGRHLLHRHPVIRGAACCSGLCRRGAASAGARHCIGTRSAGHDDAGVHGAAGSSWILGTLPGARGVGAAGPLSAVRSTLLREGCVRVRTQQCTSGQDQGNAGAQKAFSKLHCCRQSNRMARNSGRHGNSLGTG